MRAGDFRLRIASKLRLFATQRAEAECGKTKQAQGAGFRDTAN
jgi:hypothetical protein